MANYLDIDLEIEKIVFLENAFEGNPGIYELTWELGHFPLTIEDKYRIAHELLVATPSGVFITIAVAKEETLRHISMFSDLVALSSISCQFIIQN